MGSSSEVKMILTKKDLAILDKFEFDVPPVGVKFLAKRPDTVERLRRKHGFMRNAQEGTGRECLFMPIKKTIPVTQDRMY